MTSPDVPLSGDAAYVDPLRLPDDVREILADFYPSALIEYLAELLGCDDGHRQMIFWLEGGNLGHSELGHRRINRDELNGLPRHPG